MKLPRWWRQQREADLEAEVRSHLEMAARDRMERGETAEQATNSARREFGNVGLVKEVTRDSQRRLCADHDARASGARAKWRADQSQLGVAVSGRQAQTERQPSGGASCAGETVS